MTTSDPDWSETSVRWLRAKYPEFVPAVSKRSAHIVLGEALVKMGYLRHEMVDKAKFSESKLKSALMQRATEWKKPYHDSLVKFLTEGGYAALSGTKKSTPSFTMESVDIALDIDDTEVIEEAEAQLAPKSQVSPAHELEEILAEVALVSDERYGAW